MTTSAHPAHNSHPVLYLWQAARRVFAPYLHSYYFELPLNPQEGLHCPSSLMPQHPSTTSHILQHAMLCAHVLLGKSIFRSRFDSFEVYLNKILIHFSSLSPSAFPCPPCQSCLSMPWMNCHSISAFADSSALPFPGNYHTNVKLRLHFSTFPAGSYPAPCHLSLTSYKPCSLSSVLSLLRLTVIPCRSAPPQHQSDPGYLLLSPDYSDFMKKLNLCVTHV